MNMSAPPKSNISITIKKIDKQVLFNPEVVFKFFNTDIDNIEKVLKNFYKKDQTKININAPNGYMVGQIDGIKRNRVKEIKDIDLIVAVLSRTYGNLYIPFKDPSFTKSRFENKIVFLDKEVFN